MLPVMIVIVNTIIVVLPTIFVIIVIITKMGTITKIEELSQLFSSSVLAECDMTGMSANVFTTAKKSS